MWKPKKSEKEYIPQNPIPFRPLPNDEFIPWQPLPHEVAAEKAFHLLADEKARKLGWSRRQFIESACGMATALMVVNQFMGCKNLDVYGVDEESTLDLHKASEMMHGPFFVFDGHTHHTDYRDMDRYIETVFMNSDTNVACLTMGGGSDPGGEHRVATRELVNKLSQGKRMVIQSKVYPERGQSELDAMEEMAELQKVAAWKSYPHEGGNWRMDDPQIGIPYIEKGRELGIKTFALHKGIGPSSPEDLGVVAARYPDCKFLCFHSGMETNFTEGPYNPGNTRGVDRLIHTYLENDVANNGDNLYADLGTTWSNYATGAGANTTNAAHLIGKLLVHLGPDRILWGTDSIVLNTTPQAQISSFINFQIPTQMQDQYGYPEITDEMRAKILGLNNAAIYGIDPEVVLQDITTDGLAQMRELVRSGEVPGVSHDPMVLKSRREFFKSLREGYWA